MVKQKTARSAGREEELWQLLKSYLAGERDGAALKRELLRQLPAEQTATRPPKHGPAAPSETPPRSCSRRRTVSTLTGWCGI